MCVAAERYLDGIHPPAISCAAGIRVFDDRAPEAHGDAGGDAVRCCGAGLQGREQAENDREGKDER
ncbi:hypothetical protein SDC9_61693 [bioreactor metagenome]|uniref:Uncharacterized protein n=1 Tax=bioreactor metagenome TaxID=1076179 RepID=A0A644XGH0_9ZZZZ